MYATNGVVREIVIDVSQAMMATGRLDEIKSAAAMLIDQAEPGDTYGLISYDGAAHVVAPLTDIAGQAEKDALIAALDGLAGGTVDSAPGAGMQLALDELTNPAVPAEADKAVYLITGGDHTAGVYPLSVATGYQDEYVSLYVFGLDADPVEDANWRLVVDQARGDDSSMGEYTSVGNQDELQTALEEAGQVTSLDMEADLLTGWDTVASGDTLAVDFVVDASLGEVDLEVAFFGDPSVLSLSVQAPDGSLDFDPNLDCQADTVDGDTVTYCFVATDAATGDWILEATANGQDVDFMYWISGVTADGADGYDAYVRLLNGEVVNYPEPVVVEAQLNRELPITGIVISTTVEAPDGTYDTFKLNDVGAAPDRRAGDGIYTGYLDYWSGGEYNIRVDFNNLLGAAQLTTLGLPNPKEVPLSNPAITEKFQRYAEVQVEVQGWQEDDHADWPGDPEWPATVLALDNTGQHGRIDFGNDVDVFKLTVPSNYAGSLVLRVDSLGLGMDPYLVIYTADYSFETEMYLDFVPTSDDYLVVPLNAKPGETYYIEVWHYDEEAETGLYKISAGPSLWSDLPEEKPAQPANQRHDVYLPVIKG
ncbi:MAG: VWA domain-containing protein [Chloroflexota bacterium]|nr:MAG: VWA domain-containing protein [Chloroflexota bacterium]